MINITLITHIAQCALHSVHCAKCRLLNDGLLTRSCLTDKKLFGLTRRKEKL